jgi:hypothetical protein
VDGHEIGIGGMPLRIQWALALVGRRRQIRLFALIDVAETLGQVGIAAKVRRLGGESARRLQARIAGAAGQRRQQQGGAEQAGGGAKSSVLSMDAPGEDLSCSKQSSGPCVCANARHRGSQDRLLVVSVSGTYSQPIQPW